jgi:hypothetical protein
MKNSPLINEAKKALVDAVRLSLWSLYAIEGYPPNLIREAVETVIQEMEDNSRQINAKK